MMTMTFCPARESSPKGKVAGLEGCSLYSVALSYPHSTSYTFIVDVDSAHQPRIRRHSMTMPPEKAPLSPEASAFFIDVLSLDSIPTNLVRLRYSILFVSFPFRSSPSHYMPLFSFSPTLLAVLDTEVSNCTFQLYMYSYLRLAMLCYARSTDRNDTNDNRSDFFSKKKQGNAGPNN